MSDSTALVDIIVIQGKVERHLRVQPYTSDETGDCILISKAKEFDIDEDGVTEVETEVEDILIPVGAWKDVVKAVNMLYDI